MYAEFTDNLVTGNEMIDSQHKELIERMNKLLESCEQSNDKAVAVKTLHRLPFLRRGAASKRNRISRIRKTSRAA